MKNLDPARARWIKVRMGVLCALMATGLGAIVASAWRVQVEDHDKWREAAENQRQRRLHVEPRRGSVFDRNGTPLAVSVDVPSLSADVVEMLRGVESAEAQARVLKDASVRLASVLGLVEEELYEKLATRRRFLWLKRRISADEAEAIRAMSDPKRDSRPIRGLALEGDARRYYPAREVASTVLGFVAPDGFGKDGLELALDEELRGRSVEVKGLRDRAGRLIFADGKSEAHELAGADITLTLDEGLQHLAEQELSASMRTYETKSASLVVLDPRTGEILAMASSPGYNPNDYTDADPEARRDRPISDRFEPGSVMKPFTIAEALANGTLKPTESVYCERGSYQLGNVVIHDTHISEWMTPTQVLAKSSNIGTLKIALKLGEPALYAGFRRFGFGEPTGIPLPGEAAGVLRPKARPWVQVETANASFGQGISVTALQLALAFGAIADNGRLHEPMLIKRKMDSRGNVLFEASPKVKREVVPAWVARTVTEMLTAVVEEGGTGVEAAVPGFRVAGKTATAQKVDPKTGKYSQDKYVASFAGFVPADRPRLVIAVVLDEPMIGRYGGDLAGPVFRRVAESALRTLGVTPNHGAPRTMQVTRQDDPADVAMDVLKPPPVAVDEPAEPDPIGPPLAATLTMADYRGRTVRETVRVVSKLGLLPEIEGTGRLVRQSPEPGTVVPPGTRVHLVFEPSS